MKQHLYKTTMATLMLATIITLILLIITSSINCIYALSVIAAAMAISTLLWGTNHNQLPFPAKTQQTPKK